MPPRKTTVSWDQKRVDDGLYEDFAAQMKKMGPQALAGAVLGEHFVSAKSDKGNIFYHEPGSVDVEARFNIIGEIVPLSMGTVLSAKGNYFAPNDPPTVRSPAFYTTPLFRIVLCSNGFLVA